MGLPVAHVAASVRSEIINCEMPSYMVGQMKVVVEYLDDGKKKCTLIFEKLFSTVKLNSGTHSTIARLPEGLSPANQVHGLCITNYAAGYGHVETDGQVTVEPTNPALPRGVITPMYPSWIVGS